MIYVAIIAGIGLLSMLGIPVIAVVVASVDIAETKARSFARVVGPWLLLAAIGAYFCVAWADEQRLKEMRSTRGVSSAQR